MKPLLSIGLVGGLIFLGSRLLNAKRISEQSIVRTQNPRISKIGLDGLVFSVNALVDNPTNTRVEISKPVITFTSNGNYIASSVPSRETFSIKGLSQTSLGAIEVPISLSALSPYFSNLISRIPSLTQNGSSNPASLGMPLEYTYSLYVNGVFYQSPPERIA